MRPRLVSGLALAGSWLLGVAAGIPAAGLQTESGRAVVSKTILDAANDAINGSVTVDGIDGSFLAGLQMLNVQIRGLDGVPFAEIPELQVGYGLRDLLGGRVVMGRLTLTSPRIDLIQPRGRSMNVQEIFGSGAAEGEQPDGAEAPSEGGRLIAFRDVEISDAEVTIKTPLDSNRAAGRESEDGVGGLMWIRRFSNFSASLPYVRITSPDPEEKGVRFEVASINVLISHPELELTGARGAVEVRNDSVLLDLAEVSLPTSEAEVYGVIDLHGEGEQYDLDIRAHGVVTDRIRSLVDELPAGMMGSGRFLVRSLPSAVEFAGTDVTFEGLGGGGSASGSLSMLVGPGPQWAFRNSGLDLNNLDLEYVRAFFDTLPVAGRVTGRFEADGPREELNLGLDIVLRDSLLPDWPISVIDSRGIVSLGVPGDLVFRDYAISHADFDLSTVQLILRNIDLQGRLSGSGVINGPWLELEYEGDLTHYDNPAHVTEASGVVRIDALGDTLGVWSDLMFDSLALDGIRPSYPSVRIRGTFQGRVVTSGYLDSLFVDADLAGPAGAIFLDGHVSPLSIRRAAYGMDVRVSRLNLEGLHPRLPETMLFGRGQGTWVDDSLFGEAAEMSAELRASSVEGVSLDSISWELAIQDSMLHFAYLQASGRGVEAFAQGALGLGGGRDSTIAGSFSTDSLGVLEPFLATLFGALPNERVVGAQRPSGSVDAYLEVQG